MSESEFTRTEALRRMRLLAQDLRAANSLGRNTKVEVSVRVVNATADTLADAYDARYPDGDDLVESDDIGAMLRMYPEIRQVGSVVHLYAYDHEGILYSIGVGWLGRRDREPMLLDTDGTKIIHIENGAEVTE